MRPKPMQLNARAYVIGSPGTRLRAVASGIAGGLPTPGSVRLLPMLMRCIPPNRAP